MTNAQHNLGRVAGQVCLVTGAGSGIGRASALRLAEEGAKVCCADINDAAAAETVALIDSIGGEGFAIHLNVADPQSVTAAVNGIVHRLGRVDVLVNNAGVNLPGVFHETSDDIIDRILDVNVKGQIYCARAVIPSMLDSGGGSIINVSSVNGLVSEPFLALYSTSKGASVMLTKGIALDYAAKNIRCNCICPGFVDTPINYAHFEMLGGVKHVYDTVGSFQPIGRPGEPREIANVVLFLASDEASFMTGSVVPVDGGMTAH